jgi:hypothetical protein
MISGGRVSGLAKKDGDFLSRREFKAIESLDELAGQQSVY